METGLSKTKRIEPPVILVRPKSGQVGFGVHRLIHYVRGGYKAVDPASEEELEDQGILTEESQGDIGELHSAVNLTSFWLSGVLAIASTMMMYWGSGGYWTWIGVIAFFVALVWFTGVKVKNTTA